MAETCTDANFSGFRLLCVCRYSSGSCADEVERLPPRRHLRRPIACISRSEGQNLARLGLAGAALALFAAQSAPWRGHGRRGDPGRCLQLDGLIASCSTSAATPTI